MTPEHFSDTLAEITEARKEPGRRARRPCSASMRKVHLVAPEDHRPQRGQGRPRHRQAQDLKEDDSMAIHQISVFLENRAGQLAEITAMLADSGIDMRAISIAETADYGVLRLIASHEPQKACRRSAGERLYPIPPAPVIAVGVFPISAGRAERPVLQLLAARQHRRRIYVFHLRPDRRQGLYGPPRLRHSEKSAALLAEERHRARRCNQLGSVAIAILRKAEVSHHAGNEQKSANNSPTPSSAG